MATRTASDDTLSGSWLATRLGIDPRRIDAMRRGGELIGARAPGSQEWRYPSWQFTRGFEPVPGIERVTAAARAAGMDDRRLAELLSRRAGLTESRRLADHLHDGRIDHVVAAVRTAAPTA